MHAKGCRIQESRYEEVDDKDRQWATIQIKIDGGIHFFFYPGIGSHRALGYKTLNEYDEHSSCGCERMNSLNYSPKSVDFTAYSPHEAFG